MWGGEVTVAGNGNGGKSNGGGNGSLWLIGLVLVGALFWFVVWPALQGIQIQAGSLDLLWPLQFQPWLILLPAFWGLCAWGSLALFCWKRTREELSTRAAGTFAWLPSDQCDPSPPKVDRFGRQLAGIPQKVTHWTFWRATAVRMEMLSAGEGKVAYVVQVAEQNVSALLAAEGQIDGAELHPLRELGLALPEWHAARPVGGQEQIDE